MRRDREKARSSSSTAGPSFTVAVPPGPPPPAATERGAPPGRGVATFTASRHSRPTSGSSQTSANSAESRTGRRRLSAASNPLYAHTTFQQLGIASQEEEKSQWESQQRYPKPTLEDFGGSLDAVLRGNVIN